MVTLAYKNLFYICIENVHISHMHIYAYLQIIYLHVYWYICIRIVYIHVMYTYNEKKGRGVYDHISNSTFFLYFIWSS